MACPVAVDMEDLVEKIPAATEPTAVESMAMAGVSEGTHPAFRIRAADEIDSKNMMSMTRAR